MHDCSVFARLLHFALHSKTLNVRDCSRADIPEEDWPLYEFDHWYPLSIGGCNDETNLWPQVSEFD
jgi:hypothetical protein